MIYTPSPRPVWERIPFIAGSPPRDLYPNVALELHLKAVAKELGLCYPRDLQVGHEASR